MLRKPGLKIAPFHVFSLAPYRFTQRNDPWKDHVFRMFHGGHIFGPKVCLRTFYKLLFVCLQLFGHGFVFVYFLKRKKTTNGFGFCCGILLVFVKITGTSGRHDHIVSHPCGFNASFLSSPAHYPCTRCQSTFQNFIPAQQLTAF